MKGALIDENLPEGLAAVLDVVCLHAASLGQRMSDQELWSHAAENGLVILTKDADFFDRLSLFGSPPKVVWVRTGNLRRAALQELLRVRWPEIRSMLATGDLVEVHDDRLESIKF